MSGRHPGCQNLPDLTYTVPDDPDALFGYVTPDVSNGEYTCVFPVSQFTLVLHWLLQFSSHGAEILASLRT